MKSVIERFEGHALAVYAELLASTCRIDVEGWNSVADMLNGGSPYILAAWHGQTHLFFPFVKGRFELDRLAMIIVGDHREEVLAKFTLAVGAQAFPISMSDTTFTGARRMMALIKALQNGKFSYITPDGPDGPPRVAKDGVAFLATRTEALLVPVGAYCRTCYRIKRWDRYALPMPFSRIRIAIGEPIQATRDMDRTQLLRELSHRMDKAIEDAEAG